MFPLLDPKLAIYEPCSPSHFVHLVATPNGFFPGVVVTCGEERGTGRFPVGEKRGKIGVWRCGLWPMEKVMSEEVSHWEDSVLTMQSGNTLSPTKRC